MEGQSVRHRAVGGLLLGLKSTATAVGIFLAAIAVLVVVFLGLSFFLWGEGGCSCAPSDSKMSQHFTDNRAEFEGLLDGYSANELAALGVDSVDPVPWVGDPAAVFFVTFRSGGIGSHHDKGYVHSLVPPPTEERRDDGSVAYRSHHIEGDWYLYEYLDP